MTNDEAKAFWLKHNKKPRVQAQLERLPGVWTEWQTLTGDPQWCPDLNYRIHPEDLEKFSMPQQPKLDVTKPMQYTRNKDLLVTFLSEMTGPSGSKQLLFKITSADGYDNLVQTDLAGVGSFGCIVNPPQQRSVEWRAVYINGADRPHGSLESAKRNAVMSHLGFIKITTFTDGTFAVEKIEEAS